MKKVGTVLLAEDDESVLEVLEVYVRSAGLRAVTARDGRAALQLADAENPDVAVLDIMMPEIHGVAVCHSLKTNPRTKHIPVIIVSAKNFPADRKQVAEAGADAFLPKPVKETDFIATIQKFLK